MKSQQAVLVFTDLVDSVKLQQRAGPAVYVRLKARHDALIKAAIDSCSGARIVESTGDGFYLSFPTCSAAVEACLRFQHGLAADKTEDYTLRARVGIHCGEVYIDDAVTNPFVGMAPSMAARVMSLALPGQILVTEPVYHDAHQTVRHHPHVESVDEQPTLRWSNHGKYLMKGGDFPIGIFEVGAVGIAPLRTPPNGEKGTRVEGANSRADDEPSSNDDVWRKLLRFSWIAAIVVAILCGWGAWTFFGGDPIQTQPGFGSSGLDTLPSVAPLAKPRPERYEIELTKLVCEKSNSVAEDHVTIQLSSDGVEVPVKYPDNHIGTPCKYLKPGGEWIIGTKLIFKERITAVFDDLAGVPVEIGRTGITPEIIEQQQTSALMQGHGLSKHRYRLEWKVLNEH